MKRAHHYLSPLAPCPYLPDRLWQLENLQVRELTSQEYLAFINDGWRRFGFTLFRPRCPDCHACQPIRIPVEHFRPNRIQRRTLKKNSELLKREIDRPKHDLDRLDLYVRHHEYHAETRNWPLQDFTDATASILQFTMSPIPIQEWSFSLDGKLVAIAYIDELPDGFSGIYFFWAPEHQDLSLGRFICLSMIEKARERGLPFVYLGYYVKGCTSMEYKAEYKPNQILAGGEWIDFMNC